MKALRAILGIVIVVFVILAVWKIVPPYFHNYQFEDVIADEARMNTYTQKSEDDIRESIWRKSKDLEIPITREQIMVQRESGAVSIAVDYTVHVDLPGYPFDLQFHPSSKNKSF